MAKVIVLGGTKAGQSTVLFGRYVFVDGTMAEESDENAKLKYEVIRSMYPCEMLDQSEYLKRTKDVERVEE